MNKVQFFKGIWLAIAITLSACISPDNSKETYPSGKWESKTSKIVAEPATLNCNMVESNGIESTHMLKNGREFHFGSYFAPITVTCNHDGYYPYTTVVKAQMSGKAAALSMFAGGLAMVAQNSAAGNGLLYPIEVRVRLEPKQFPNAAARDSWYKTRIVEVRAERKRNFSDELTNCDGGVSDRCTALEDDLDDQIAAEIGAMNARRLAAKIAP
jgi:hypothetical protein